jgi:hypothetical protein
MQRGKEQLASAKYMAETVKLANIKLRDSRAKIEKLRVAIDGNELF